MLFCTLTKVITLNICRLCVCVLIHKCSLEPFMCLDLVFTTVLDIYIYIFMPPKSNLFMTSLIQTAVHTEWPCFFLGTQNGSPHGHLFTPFRHWFSFLWSRFQYFHTLIFFFDGHVSITFKHWFSFYGNVFTTFKHFLFLW